MGHQQSIFSDGNREEHSEKKEVSQESIVLGGKCDTQQRNRVHQQTSENKKVKNILVVAGEEKVRKRSRDYSFRKQAITV